MSWIAISYAYYGYYRFICIYYSAYSLVWKNRMIIYRAVFMLIGTSTSQRNLTSVLILTVCYQMWTKRHYIGPTDYIHSTTASRFTCVVLMYIVYTLGIYWSHLTWALIVYKVSQEVDPNDILGHGFKRRMNTENHKILVKFSLY